MSFDDLYESCFRNLPITTGSNGETSPFRSTLDHLLSHYRYVIFLHAPSKSGELLAKLSELVKKLNDSDNKEKCESSPARLRRFFGLKKRKKKENSIDSLDVAVIRIDGDGQDIFPECFSFVSLDLPTKSRLMRSLQLELVTTVLVLESCTRCVITWDGKRLLNEDPTGKNFPWCAPPIEELVNGDLVKKEGDHVEKYDRNLNEVSVKALFFGAYWCPPCRQWLADLNKAYTGFVAAGLSFEIIFCSSDRSVEAFNSFLSQMSFPAFSYDPSRTIHLTRCLGVAGIPSLILLNEKNEVLSKHGRSVLLEDVRGEHFPWGPRELYELTECSVFRIRLEPSLILFTEGSPDDILFSHSVLHKTANSLFEERKCYEKNKNEDGKEGKEEKNECPPTAHPLQVFFTGDDPVCDYILEKVLGLGEAALPLLVIVDGLLGYMSVCEDDDVSEEVVSDFVSKYRSNSLEWKALPIVEHALPHAMPQPITPTLPAIGEKVPDS